MNERVKPDQLAKSSGTPPWTGFSRPPKETYIAAANRLLRCFRTVEATDPKVFITGIVTILYHYPIEIVERVCDPYSGIPGKQNWVPTHFEVRTACDEIYLPMLMAAERQRAIKRQLDERNLIEDQTRSRPAQTFEEIKAEMAARGIFFGRNPKIETAEMVKAKLGITEEQWKALPDQPAKADRG